MVDRLEVFADISCPFAYVGVTRLVAERAERGFDRPLLAVRAWPLQLVNGEPQTGPSLVEEIEALRRSVAPELFTGFDPDRFPRTTLPALAAEAAAQATGPEVGERFSLAVRHALFEEGADIADPSVLADLLAAHDVDPGSVDPDAVPRSHAEGAERGVVGSPHFFAGDDGWFCPALTIRHDESGVDIEVDVDTLRAFYDRIFGGPAPPRDERSPSRS